VEALLEGIERVRRGELTHTFSVNADEEFRVLADSFNQAHMDLKSAQDNVLQMEKMAAVGRLGAGIAHEVSNPLCSISSVVQMMNRRCESEEQAEHIDLIMQQIERISRIVQDLLTFSRDSRNNRHDRVDIAGLLERATALMKYDQRAQRCRIVCAPDRGLDEVQGNADQLLLVFTNIMINALDAMGTGPDGSGVLTISARQEEERIVVRFEDNGSGMNESQIAKTRSSRSLRPRNRGSVRDWGCGYATR
jgi:C4-dicarboxylate-specific signal transduction histidine kinase